MRSKPLARKLNQGSAEEAEPSRTPSEVEVRGGGGVWARDGGSVPRGTRYGPFTGKWVSEPLDSSYAWEVRVAGNRGYFDGTLEFSNWLKYVRSSDKPEEANLRAFLTAGQQVYYEAVLDVKGGEELILGPKEPLRPEIHENSKSGQSSLFFNFDEFSGATGEERSADRKHRPRFDVHKDPLGVSAKAGFSKMKWWEFTQGFV
ncbi:hypothetical protein GE061_002580 [Apolygus lucorum]|uniref:SET domain-containing protein n=1 Tax=Apolygus lucorum TaxID=248454 RepID=A0A8S9X552_APOLU|nr:hypothetical protein GE061_002580 [Apolygus lucorum]